MISGFVRKSSLLAALVFVACGKDSSGPTPVATTVALSNATTTTAVAGSVVTPALTFTVKDQNGNIMSGVPLTITVTGGGTLTGAPTATAAGETSIGTWTLGQLVGTNTLTIKAGDLAPITFTITTIAGPAAQIQVVTGNGQTQVAGGTLDAITVKVSDQFGNGVPNRPVTISVAEGGGSVSISSAITDAAGNVAGIVWTLGKSALPQRLAVGSDTFSGSVLASVTTSYQLEVRYFGGTPTDSVQQAFTRAAARIRGAVTGTLGLVQFNNTNLQTNCGVTGVTITETIRDLVIYAEIHPIDGVGKILGAAGPCLIRSTNKLTIIGVMEFDSDDLANMLATPGRLEAVILHEMNHVVGIGTLWDEKVPSLAVGLGGPDPRFTGSSAAAACLAAGGTTLCSGGVAVENCVGIPNCGAGTVDSHWREGSSTIPGFRTELMTGFISNGITNPYSNISIQSLGDLGYTVNSLAADPYNVPNPSLSALLQLNGPVNPTTWEHVRLPRATVSQTGQIRSIDRQSQQ